MIELRTGITVEQHPIGQVFSDRYSFAIPPYQRPYVWTTEHAGQLLSDLLDALRDTGQGNDTSPYFLGSIVLIKGDRPESQVIDGQQRLITLTILLAVLRPMLPTKYQVDITQLLYAPPNALRNLPGRYRLQPKEHDADFLKRYVQDEDGVGRLEAEMHPTLRDSQRHMLENAQHFLKEVRALAEDERVRLAQFITEHCILIIVSTSDHESAYRIFTVLNNRGLNLTPADILKAEVIGRILDEEEQREYTARWERTEESLGRKDFDQLLGDLATIYRRQKSRSGTMIDDFRLNVAQSRTPQQVIDEIIEPAGKALYVIRNRCFPDPEYGERINTLLYWLNQMDGTDWMAPALVYLMRYQDQPQRVLRFLTDLERLAASMMIRQQYRNHRIPRYVDLVRAIQRGDDLGQPYSPLQLTGGECQQTLQALSGDVYLMWATARQYLLRRLDALLAGTAMPVYPQRSLTVEHILPRTVRADSEWARTFTFAERGRYVHKLGNLALLSRAKNEQASNYDFARKRDTYLRPANGIPPYALTAQVLAEQEWTPAVIERRQAELIGHLRRLWRL